MAELKGVSGGKSPPSLNGSWQLSASRQQCKPTTSHPAHTWQRKASSLPSGSHLFSVSYLHISLPLPAKQPQFISSFLISYIFSLPPTILFGLFSTKNLSQKCRANLSIAKRNRQLLALFAGYLPVEGRCLHAFLFFKTIQFLPHIQLATASQPIF